jgi:hypothetical protein
MSEEEKRRCIIIGGCYQAGASGDPEFFPLTYAQRAELLREVLDPEKKLGAEELCAAAVESFGFTQHPA